MVPDHGTKYEGNTASHHGGMHENGQMDRRTCRQVDGWTGPDPIFPNSAIVEWGILSVPTSVKSHIFDNGNRNI